MDARRLVFVVVAVAMLISATRPVLAADEPPAGLGLALHIDEQGRVLVRSIVSDSPAAASGMIHVGDQILAVADGDGRPVDLAGKDLNAVVAKIRGRKGTLVRLTIVPEGKSTDDRQVVSVRRGDIKMLNFFGDGQRLPVGTVAPDVTLTSLVDDKTGALSQHRGKILVVEFWAAWCRPCIDQLDMLEIFLERNPTLQGKVEVLAISVDDDKAKAAEKARDMNWQRVTLVWTTADVLKKYHVSALPTVYLLDKDGRVSGGDNRVDLGKLLEDATGNGKE